MLCNTGSPAWRSVMTWVGGRRGGGEAQEGGDTRMGACVLSRFSSVRVQLFVTLRTLACQAPLSMGFSRQEHWSGLPCPPPGDLHNLGIKLISLMSAVSAGTFFTTFANWQLWLICVVVRKKSTEHYKAIFL